jgi:glycosyltransferase involved in cell wall biosynthesis
MGLPSGYCVTIFQEFLPEYRYVFFNKLHYFLGLKGVQLRLVFSQSDCPVSARRFLPWSIYKNIIRLGPFRLQRFSSKTLSSDLIIFPQENKYIAAPVLMLLSLFGSRKIAFWGHGKNFQACNPNSLSERWKRLISRHVDWWFAYNSLSAKIVKSYGYPESRITKLNNSIDTHTLSAHITFFSPLKRNVLRRHLGITSPHVAIFSGRFHHHKRIPFLLEACRQVRRSIPDFELLILGEGPDLPIVRQAARENTWIHFFGAKYGIKSIPLWSLAKVSLMPGLVGLGIIDSFAMAVPMITTAYPFHSPEIDYIVHGKNGWIVADWKDSKQYAKAVIRILTNEPQQLALKEGCRRSLRPFSSEKMAARFARGILRCLVTPKIRGGF